MLNVMFAKRETIFTIVLAKLFIPGPVITRYVKCYMIACTKVGERHLNLTHAKVSCRTRNCVNVSLCVTG